MNVYFQSEKVTINPDTEMNYAYRTSFQNITFPQYHDFYEFNLILDGVQAITVNDHRITLPTGALILIRPNDIHSRSFIVNGGYINFAFSKNVAQDMYDYLGEGFPMNSLLSSDTPPYVILNKEDSHRVYTKIQELNIVSAQNVPLQRTMLRTMILQLFVQYFANAVNSSPPLPENYDWLSFLLAEMNRPSNIVRGLPALLELSGKTHEHICRTFRQALGCTPTEYINDLRLNYAANYLLHSDINVIDICYNCGFNNISHFYHLFSAKYHMSPAQYRKENSIY